MAPAFADILAYFRFDDLLAPLREVGFCYACSVEGPLSVSQPISASVWNRRNLAVAVPFGEGPFTTRFADLPHRAVKVGGLLR
jgi:hypothetical protein